MLLTIYKIWMAYIVTSIVTKTANLYVAQLRLRQPLGGKEFGRENIPVLAPVHYHRPTTATPTQDHVRMNPVPGAHQYFNDNQFADAPFDPGGLVKNGPGEKREKRMGVQCPMTG